MTYPQNRQAFFGDLHLHTALSFDAYAWMGARVMPEEAYRFARGDMIDYFGQPVRRARPLDFLAVTDHSENLGVFNQLDDANSELSQTQVGKLMRSGGRDAFFEAMGLLGKGASVGSNAPAVSTAAWARVIKAANDHYVPGRFTTFVGYEWSVNPGNQNLHRNIIFRGSTAPAPFTRFDGDKPEALWAWLAQIRKGGDEALAIPHNGNVSNGLMWDMVKSDGSPIDATWAQLRIENEPLAEIVQNKGTSETHPLLSPNDEFAGFELYEWLLAGKPVKGKAAGSFWRDALGRGLALEARTGVNPYRIGAVGAGDLHSGISDSSEANYARVGKAHLGGGKLTRDEVAAMLSGEANAAKGPVDFTVSSGALTGVWAESNTRVSLYAAFRRKETFATSGTRIKVRFFAGRYSGGMLRSANWIETAYAKGVAMGGNWNGAAHFIVQALKDPDGANLDRIQIVKVSLEKGTQRERIFDASRSGPGGSPELKVQWRDPSPSRSPAVYYARVLEVPTPRWSTLRAQEAGLTLPKSVPHMIQERAWTSPIWVSAKVR